MEGKTIVGFTILSKCEWDTGRGRICSCDINDGRDDPHQ